MLFMPWLSNWLVNDFWTSMGTHQNDFQRWFSKVIAGDTASSMFGLFFSNFKLGQNLTSSVITAISTIVFMRLMGKSHYLRQMYRPGARSLWASLADRLKTMVG
jgi:hypothetical protein